MVRRPTRAVATELILEGLFIALGEIIGTGLVEILLDAAVRGVWKPYEEQRPMRRWIAWAGLIIAALPLGFIALAIYPHRVTPALPIPGLSLVITPLFTGWLMHRYGNWKKRRGKPVTLLASFPGGALFAFIMTIIRFAIVR